jgi:pimeloyl-ACP methyl ester carboxylesterase
MKLILLLFTLGCGSAPAVVELSPTQQVTVCSEGPADGLPVVLVPGLSGCAYAFRNLTPLLHDQGLRTIIIEPLAVGESSRPEDADYTMTAQAERIAAVLDRMDIRGALFVGQGIGGSMVFRLAVDRPELIAGFVSIEAGSAEVSMNPNNRKTLLIAKAVAKLGGQSVLKDRFEENLVQSSGDASWIDRRTVGRYFRGMGRDISASLNAFDAMAQQAEPWAMTPRLPEVAVPVTVLLGDAPHDGGLTEEDIEVLRQGLTQVEFLDISGAGHFIFEEQPEAVAEAVRLMVIRLGDTLPTSDGTASVTGHDGGSDLVQPSSIGQ